MGRKKQCTVDREAAIGITDKAAAGGFLGNRENQGYQNYKAAYNKAEALQKSVRRSDHCIFLSETINECK